MKKQPFKQMPADFCLFCDLGHTPRNGVHPVPVHDHQNNTVNTFNAKCNKRKES